MAQQVIHADLLHRGYPFNVESIGSQVILNRGLELNRNRGDARGSDAGAASGMPQCYYLQNVFPTSRGYSSVHFRASLPPHPFGKSVRASSFHVLGNELGTSALFSPAYGDNIIYNPAYGGWNSFPIGARVEAKSTVTYLQGVSYVLYQGVGLYAYDFQANTFEQIELEGIEISEILGVTSGKNYLVLWSNNRVYWSSGVDATDFVPSLVTGAGSSNVLSSSGQITSCLKIAEGFVVYTASNAIAASYSGNATSPWIFREIPGSAGASSPETVSYESNEEAHIAWTSSGFQRVSVRKAEPIWAELTDSISRGFFGDLDTTTGIPFLNRNAKLDVKVSSLGSRYTAISVRPDGDSSPFQVAYTWDWGNNRWGKLRFPHVDLFDYREPSFEKQITYQDWLDDGTTYKDLDLADTTYYDLESRLDDVALTFGENFGVASEDGSVYQAVQYPDTDADNLGEFNFLASEDTDELEVDVDPPELAASFPPFGSFIIFGRYKLMRDKDIILHEVLTDADFTGTIDAIVHEKTGKIDSVLPITDVDAKVESLYYTHLRTDSFSLKLEGKFNLVTLDFVVGMGGRRHSRRTA